MKTWGDLKQLMDRYDDEVWNIIPENGSRYSPNLEIGGGYDYVGEAWGIHFYDEFFPFDVKGETMEEAVQMAYGKLDSFYQQILTKHITVHYVVGNKQKDVMPFSIDDCRKWKRYEIDFVPYPTKEEAQNSINSKEE